MRVTPPIVGFLAAVTLVAGLFLPAHAAGPRHHVVQVRLSRPPHSAGCCDLELTRLGADSATVTDSQTYFAATASRFMLSRSRSPGYVLLWVYVAEQNARDVASALVSGTSNWLLAGSGEADYRAYPGVPPRQTGTPFLHVDALVADTNPGNQGWIWFRLPRHSGKRFTLDWSDCRPRCNQALGREAYAPVVDLTLQRSIPPSR